jgi:3-deoxy-D-manno-octulosonic-acid transferase
LQQNYRLLYSTVIRIASWVHQAGAAFIPKWRLQVTGQEACFTALQSLDPGRRVIWFHCASLGEFEQGRPVMEATHKSYPDVQLLLSFFSPSGYEIRKNFPLASLVVYLPWDTKAQAERFVAMAKPALAVFVKYEYWNNYFRALSRRSIPLISISSVFFRHQVFFRPYGKFFTKMLRAFSHLFVQDTSSKELLEELGIRAVTVAGDTRFDRVHALATQSREVEMVAVFSYNRAVLVAGSVWPEDIRILAPFINRHTELRFLVAPHDVSESSVNQMVQALTRPTLRFSQATEETVLKSDVLVIDNVGMLSALYRYGRYAWVGGAYGKGLHSILEPACYGIPVFFGNRRYARFREANDLLAGGGAFAIGTTDDLERQYVKLSDDTARENAGRICRAYVRQNLGATDIIMSHIQSVLTLRAW